MPCQDGRRPSCAQGWYGYAQSMPTELSTLCGDGDGHSWTIVVFAPLRKIGAPPHLPGDLRIHRNPRRRDRGDARYRADPDTGPECRSVELTSTDGTVPATVLRHLDMRRMMRRRPAPAQHYLLSRERLRTRHRTVLGHGPRAGGNGKWNLPPPLTGGGRPSPMICGMSPRATERRANSASRRRWPSQPNTTCHALPRPGGSSAAVKKVCSARLGRDQPASSDASAGLRRFATPATARAPDPDPAPPRSRCPPA